MSNSCVIPLKAYAECIRKTECIKSGKTIKQCFEAGDSDPSNKVCASERQIYQHCKKAQILDPTYGALKSKLLGKSNDSAAAAK